MTEFEALVARVDRLEARVAFQDQTIEELNQSILDQWKQIEALKRQLARLGDQMKDVEDNLGRTNQPEPPPPHY